MSQRILDPRGFGPPVIEFKFASKESSFLFVEFKFLSKESSVRFLEFKFLSKESSLRFVNSSFYRKNQVFENACELHRTRYKATRRLRPKGLIALEDSPLFQVSKKSVIVTENQVRFHLLSKPKFASAEQRGRRLPLKQAKQIQNNRRML